MYMGTFFTGLFMVLGVVVVIALVPQISKSLLLKNANNKQYELRKNSRCIDIYFLIAFIYFCIPFLLLEWKENWEIVAGAAVFCLDVATFWQCKHHYFCYMLLFEQRRRWKKHKIKLMKNLRKGSPESIDNLFDEFNFITLGFYKKEYPNKYELDYHSMCVTCMMLCAGMCVLFTLSLCGVLIGFGTIFAGVSKFWCSAPEVLWYNLHHIEELPLNIWFYIAVAGCAVLLVLVLTSICNYVKKAVKKS